MSETLMLTRLLRLATAGLALLILAGCSGSGAGSELSARPDPRPLTRTQGRTLHLPREERFSIALAPAQKAPGLTGAAEASAVAERDGRGDASADVHNGGAASATFQIGHVFSNDSERQIDLHVQSRFDCEYTAQADPGGDLDDAVVSLNVYARDGKNRLLKTVNVFQHSTKEGAAASKDHKEVEFTLTLGPGDAISVFLGGNVQVQTKEGRSAGGKLKLSALEMDIESTPAPPVKATSRP